MFLQMFLIIKFPAHTAIIPKNMLNAVYVANNVMLPTLSKAIFSFAKVENVVNPPQKPTVNSVRHSAEMAWFFSKSP